MTRLGAPRKCTPEEVYSEVESHILHLGIPPTLEELRDQLGVGSTRTVARYLQDLEERGWIKRWKGARGIKLTREEGP